MSDFEATGNPAWELIAGDERALTHRLVELANRGLTVRHLRGRHMTATPGVFAQLAAALQFPAYAGANWHAVDECLGDLSWLSVTRGVVLAISDADMVMADEPAELPSLVATFGYAADEWAHTTETGLGADRPSLPFVVVLQASPETAATASRRWIDAGATALAGPDA